MLQQLIDRLFHFERIDGHGAVARYLHRWTLLRLPGGRALYLHHFVGSDWSRDLHDHPKGFLSIGLWGGYIEFTPARPDGRRWRAPWVRYFPATHIHRLEVPRNCWTLVYVGKLQRNWGFHTAGSWMPWDEYVRLYGGKRA